MGSSFQHIPGHDDSGLGNLRCGLNRLLRSDEVVAHKNDTIGLGTLNFEECFGAYRRRAIMQECIPGLKQLHNWFSPAG